MRPAHSNRQPRRRGTIYLAVLGVTMIVAVMALTSMSVSRLELRIASDAADLREARLLARTGVEFGLHWITEESHWRDQLSNDTEEAAEPLGNGTFTWKVTDPDGDLADDPRDNVTLTGYGRVGRCVAAESVTLQPAEEAVECLEFGLVANGPIILPAGSSLFGNTQIDSNAEIAFNGLVDSSASRSGIVADVWSTGTVTGSITGSIHQSQSNPLTLPGDDAFAYYVANGTPIDIDTLPDVAGAPTLQKLVLSPATNPFGATNPEGIYVIDCRGQRLYLQGVRVVGTLVILNPGAGSGCRSAVRIENAVANYPALMVDGDFDLRTGTLGIESLSETLYNSNFNPPGTPYEGTEDTDTSDTLPAALQGLVYVTGTAKVADHTTVTGCLLAGQLAVVGTVELTADYRETYLNYPPPGFRTSERMEILPGSWRRAAGP